MAKVTFDGPNRRINIDPTIISIDVETDLYSDWKEWSLIGDNIKYLPAFRTTGGDPLPGGRRVGQYFFLINDWKLVAPNDMLTTDIEIEGNLFTDDGSDIFAVGASPVRLIRQVVSQFTEISMVSGSGGGLTTIESAQLSGLVTVNNLQTQSLDVIIISQSLANSQLVNHTQFLQAQSASLATQLNLMYTQSASLAIINSKVDTLLVNTAGSGSLTPEQATMMLEMYRMLGLDPTRPLIVTPTARDVGVEISQTISKVGDMVTVTRDP